MFMEVCHRYLYLSEGGLSTEDAAFRQSLYYYHLNAEKYKLYLQSDVAADTLKGFEEGLPESKAQLLEYPAYKALHKKRADDVRAGNVCMHLTDEEVSLRFGLMHGKFKQMYRLLSAHAHGAPFATSSQSDERGRGIENETETGYVYLALGVLQQYLSKAIVSQADMLSLTHRAPDEYQIAVDTLADCTK
jgi:putative NIF3 family GTP cyclohydrolase 1 type 2